MKLDIQQRRAGILTPVFALRTSGDLGIGDTGGMAELIDWCATTGLSVIQVLPINETSDDNSPYNTISSLALDPTTLQISEVQLPGITRKDIQEIATPNILSRILAGPVKYRFVKKLKHDLLGRAFFHFISLPTYEGLRGEFSQYLREEAAWLENYSRFRTLVDLHGHPNWEIWPETQRTPAKLDEWLRSLSEQEAKDFSSKALFFSYVQWVLHRQWSHIRSLSESKGVYLMGDMPFGVSRHSADVWAHPELFNLQWSVGAPPEPFFRDNKFTELWGQNWGMPLYRWDEMRKDGFSWWQQRVHGVARYFQLFRVDHVLGFYRVYAFPWQPKDNGVYVDMTREDVKEKLGHLPQFLPGDDQVPEEAKINEAQGEELLKMVVKAAGDSTVVAEDLGMVPNYVRPSLAKLGISGFKIPVFEREESSQEYKKPEEYPVLSVATLATHDHETMYGLWEQWWHLYEEGELRRTQNTLDAKFEETARVASWEIYRTQRFCRLDDHKLWRPYDPVVREAMCRRLFESKSWLAILMVTDLFSLRLRFNVPGPVAESNWSERLPFDIADLETSAPLVKVSQFITKLAKETRRS